MQDGGLEDLLVILADKRWKGKRVDLLEERMTRLLTDEALQPFFEVFLTVSNVAETLARDADARLAWQNAFGASVSG